MEEDIQYHPVYFRAKKCVSAIAYLGLVYLTIEFVLGDLSWRLAAGAIGLSAVWLILVRLELNKWLNTYFDLLSRLEFLIPLVVGSALSVAAPFLTSYWIVRLLAIAEIICWFSLYMRYRQNRHLFKIQGHGPLPADCWVNPPAEALLPGDLMLTSGQVAARLRESVGHAEMVIRMRDGSMMAFSSYMKKGTVLNPLNEIASAQLVSGHYIVLRMRRPWIAEQIERSADIAQEMVETNAKWKQVKNERRKKLIDSLPLSEEWRQRIYAMCAVTGYDWFGLFMGRLTKNHWTCIGACIELYRRLGVKTNPYGSGILGFGATFLDPLEPVRFLSDPAFHLLSSADQERFEKEAAEAKSGP